MPTTYIPFVPSLLAPFTFQATYDAAIYANVVTWNLYSQRYYVNIYDLSANLIVCLPLIGSPTDYDISLTGGYFTTKLVYRIQAGQFEVIDADV